MNFSPDKTPVEVIREGTLTEKYLFNELSY